MPRNSVLSMLAAMQCMCVQTPPCSATRVLHGLVQAAAARTAAAACSSWCSQRAWCWAGAHSAACPSQQVCLFWGVAGWLEGSAWASIRAPGKVHVAVARVGPMLELVRQHCWCSQAGLCCLSQHLGITAKSAPHTRTLAHARAEETTGRTYALKRMRKSGVVQCPEHVFCEQTITRNLTHPFCIRQYGSFQVRCRCLELPKS